MRSGVTGGQECEIRINLNIPMCLPNEFIPDPLIPFFRILKEEKKTRIDKAVRVLILRRM